MRHKIEFFFGLPLGLKAMIVSAFTVAFGSFMITPFLGIFLKHSIEMSIDQIGMLLAAATFIHFGGGVLGGAVAESYGLKRTMIGSLMLRTLGFLMLAASVYLPLLVIPAILIGAFGPALYLPANRAFIISSVALPEKPLFLALSSAALNMGMALGPLIAVLLITDKPAILFVSVAVLFAVITLIHQKTLPQIVEKDSGKRFLEFKTRLPEALTLVWKPLLVNVVIYYCYFYFQNFMGIYVTQTVGINYFSLITLLNFSCLVILQPIFARWIAQTEYRLGMAAGFAILGTGMLIMGYGTVLHLCCGTILMTIGQSFLFLKGDLEIISRLPDMPAMAFGIQRLAVGTGGLISGVVGGKLYAVYELEPGHFWINAGVQGIVAGLLVLVFLSLKVFASFTPRDVPEAS